MLTPKAFWRKNRTGEFPAPPTPRWGPAGGVLVRWCTSTVVHRGAIQCARWTGRRGSMTIPENVLRELWVGKDRGFLRFALSCYACRRAGSVAQTAGVSAGWSASEARSLASSPSAHEESLCHCWQRLSVVLVVEVIGCRLSCRLSARHQHGVFVTPLHSFSIGKHVDVGMV